MLPPACPRRDGHNRGTECCKYEQLGCPRLHIAVLVGQDIQVTPSRANLFPLLDYLVLLACRFNYRVGGEPVYVFNTTWLIALNPAHVQHIGNVSHLSIRRGRS